MPTHPAYADALARRAAHYTQENIVKILDAIPPRQTVSKSDIARKVQPIPREGREMIIRNLIADGYIIERKVLLSGRKPATFYSLAE